MPLHTLNLTLSNSFSGRNLFNYEIKDKDTHEKVFELAHFSTRLQHPMEWHLVQLVFTLSRDNLLFRKKNKVHSHRDIYSINIILQCPLLLINSWIEEGCQIKYMRQAQKVLWVVLSSLFFKEIWKNDRTYDCKW